MKRILLIDGENLKGKIKTVFETQEEFAHIKNIFKVLRNQND